MDARIVTDYKETDKQSMILGGPKPTSYLDYLEASHGRKKFPIMMISGFGVSNNTG